MSSKTWGWGGGRAGGGMQRFLSLCWKQMKEEMDACLPCYDRVRNVCVVSVQAYKTSGFPE